MSACLDGQEISRRHFLRIAGRAGIAVAAVPASSGLVAACSKGSGNAATLKVGVMAPFSGTGQFIGDVVTASLTAAVKQINSTGGMGGRKVELLLRDTASDPAMAATTYRDLSGTKDLLGLLWCGAPGFEQMLPQIQRDGLPVITVFDDPLSAGKLYPQSTANRSVFQMSVPETFALAAMATYANHDRGYSSAAVLFDHKLDDTFDLPGATGQRFQQAFSNTGVTVSGTETFATGDSDFTAQLGRVQSAAPQVVYVDGLADDAATIAIALDAMGAGYVDTPTAKGQGWHPHLFGSFQAINQLWADNAAEAAKVGSITAWHIGGLHMLPSYTIAKWLAKFVGTPPRGGESLPADGLAALLHGLDKAGTNDRQKVVQGMETMTAVTFASVPFSFSAARHCAVTEDDIALLTLERLRGPATTDPPYQLGAEWKEGGALASAGGATTLLVRPTLDANRRAQPGAINAAVQGGYGTQCTKHPDGSLRPECKIH